MGTTAFVEIFAEFSLVNLEFCICVILDPGAVPDA
jgi:hypothetical protein